MRYRGNKIYPDERMDVHSGQTAQKHTVLTDIIGWQRHWGWMMKNDKKQNNVSKPQGRIN